MTRWEKLGGLYGFLFAAICIGSALRSFRGPPLGAKIAFSAPLWVVAWFLFFSGLGNLSIDRKTGGILRLLSFFLIMGVSVAWIVI